MSGFLRRLPLRNDKREGPSKSSNLPKIRQIYAPPPLPPKRKRTLTLPLPLSEIEARSKRRQWTSDQACCGFFQVLPYDIRRIVYQILLADETFHIIRLRKKLRHVRCTAYQKTKCSNKTCWGMSTVDGILLRDLEKESFGQGLLDLLRTCRRAYTEAIGILYSQNTYDVNGPESIVSLSNILLPHRFNAIRSLQLTWAFFHPNHPMFGGEKILLPGDEALWTVCWAIVADMQGLNDIRVWLSMSPATKAPCKAEKELFNPLVEIGPKKRFEVRVSWISRGPEHQTEERYPFRLIRLEQEDWGASYLRRQTG